MHDLAIIVVSTNEAHWLRPCLRTVFAHLGDIRADVVVVDNDSHDGTADLVAAEFPAARVVRSRNHGFCHANNRAIMTVDARYVLLLNPDTEIAGGTFAELLALLDARPAVGLAGVRQVTGEGELVQTIRLFPSALSALGDALSAERLARRPRWLGERVMDRAAYERESPCDWTTGAFMLVRREAIESAGLLDERFFMYSDEADFCRRIKTAGWDVRHLPQMTIVHHAFKDGVKPSVEILSAHSRMKYARKHFSPVHRAAFQGAVVLRHALRAVYAGGGETGRPKRAAHRQVIATLLGRAPVPYADRTSPVAVMTADPELR
jgi:N-acetylglucosaminyl-diphospho-decaprenol L-rhamnosyltransferase